MSPQQINWAIYNSLPPKEAQYQLTHIHDSRKSSIAAAYSTCLLMAFIAILMRFLSRRIGRVLRGADDWTIVVAYVFTLAYATPALLGKTYHSKPRASALDTDTNCFSATFKYGGGQHLILMTDSDPANFTKAVFAAELLYAPAIATVKISTVFLFARIFPNKKFKVFLWALGIFISLYTTILILADIFQCKPIQAAWDLNPKADCIQIKSVFIVMSTMNVVTDFALLLAPIPQLWALQIRREVKIELIGIFSIGGFITVVSIYRIPKLNSFSALDAGWSDVDTSIWSIVEICVSIVCASTITYRPLFDSALRISSSLSGSNARVSSSSATRSPYSQGSHIRSASTKGGDVSLQALNPASGHDKPQPSEHGDAFLRMED